MQIWMSRQLTVLLKSFESFQSFISKLFVPECRSSNGLEVMHPSNSLVIIHFASDSLEVMHPSNSLDIICSNSLVIIFFTGNSLEVMHSSNSFDVGSKSHSRHQKHAKNSIEAMHPSGSLEVIHSSSDRLDFKQGTSNSLFIYQYAGNSLGTGHAYHTPTQELGRLAMRVRVQ